MRIVHRILVLKSFLGKFEGAKLEWERCLKNLNLILRCSDAQARNVLVGSIVQ